MNELILLLKQYKKEIDEYNQDLSDRLKDPEYMLGVYGLAKDSLYKKVTLDGFLEWLAEGKGDDQI